MRPLALAPLIAAAAARAASPALDHQLATHPDPSACQQWEGHLEDNGHHVGGTLCIRGDQLSGTLRFDGPVWWDVVSVEGRVEAGGARLVFHDVKQLTAQPPPGVNGASYCLIERYELARTAPGTYEGTYHAPDCERPDAAITLRATHPIEEAAQRPPLPAPTATSARASGCALSAGPAPAWPIASLLLPLLRRRRGRLRA